MLVFVILYRCCFAWKNPYDTALRVDLVVSVAFGAPHIESRLYYLWFVAPGTRETIVSCSFPIFSHLTNQGSDLFRCIGNTFRFVCNRSQRIFHAQDPFAGLTGKVRIDWSWFTESLGTEEGENEKFGN